jgi:hypothetical protein
VGVANIPQDVRVQGVTTIRLFGSRRLPSLWRSSITFRGLGMSSTLTMTINTTSSYLTPGYTRWPRHTQWNQINQQKGYLLVSQLGHLPSQLRSWRHNPSANRTPACSKGVFLLQDFSDEQMTERCRNTQDPPLVVQSEKRESLPILRGHIS